MLQTYDYEIMASYLPTNVASFTVPGELNYRGETVSFVENRVNEEELVEIN